MPPIEYQLLTWDTSFFGFPIAKLSLKDFSRLDANLVSAKKDKIRLLYWAIPKASETAIKAKKEVREFVGDQVTFRKKLARPTAITLTGGYFSQRHDESDPDEKMVDLAIQAGSKSRFKVDRHFRDSEFRRLYTTWIANSCNGQIADVVLVVNGPNNQKVGLVTVAIKDQDSTIGLLSVSPGHRLRGIGKALIELAENFALQYGCRELRVVTQVKNLDATKLYQRQGFSEASIESYFHLWLEQ